MAHYTPRYNTNYYDHQAQRDFGNSSHRNLEPDSFREQHNSLSRLENFTEQDRGEPLFLLDNYTGRERDFSNSRLDGYVERDTGLLSSRLENYEDRQKGNFQPIYEYNNQQERDSPTMRQYRYGDMPGYRYPDQPLDSYRQPLQAQPNIDYALDQRDRTPVDKSAYLFIRFPSRGGTDVNVAAQACVLNKKSAEIQRGRFLGIARKIHEYGTPSARDEALLVYLFDSAKNARLFFISDKRFKQPDFPQPSGHCDAWSVCRYYSPDNQEALSTYMMSEIRLQLGVTHSQYKQRYCTHFAQLLLDYGANPFVIQANSVEFLRRHFISPDTIVTLHLFRSRDQLKQIQNDDRYLKLTGIHSKLAKVECTVFTLDPTPCP